MTNEKRTGVENERIAIARAAIYRFLSRCFSHPDTDLPGLFDSVRLEEFLQAWCCLGLEGLEDIDSATNWLAKWPSQEAALLELGKEYTRLFITAYPKVVAPPYSSVYLDKEHLVWGKSTAEAARLYEAAGLGISEDFHDIPDHIAAELEFVSYLILEQQKPEQTGVATTQKLAAIEKQFLTGHFFKWAPRFVNLVVENSRAAFYRSIAHLTSKFTEYEARCIGHRNASLMGWR